MSNEEQTNETSWNIGQRIKQARLACGLGQTEFADRMGKTQSAVSQWERESSISIDALAKAAIVLGVSTDWLLGLEAFDIKSYGARRRKVSGLGLIGALAKALDADELSQAQIDLMTDLLTQLRNAP